MTTDISPSTPPKKKREANPNAIHYIDNAKFFEEMKAYHEAYHEAKAASKPKPRLSDYAGSCFIKIAERLSLSPMFRNYPFREEMVAHGIENCVQCAHSFNPSTTQNPFAYFTQVTYWAFFRKMQDEKKQLYIRAKMALRSDSLDVLAAFQDESQADDNGNAIAIDTTYLSDFVRKYEEGQAIKLRRRKERRDQRIAASEEADSTKLRADFTRST